MARLWINRKAIVLFSITSVFLSATFTEGNKNPTGIRDFVRLELDSLAGISELAIQQLESDDAWNNSYNLLNSYHKLRKHYKHIEFFVEYYSSSDAKLFIHNPSVHMLTTIVRTVLATAKIHAGELFGDKTYFRNDAFYSWRPEE